MLANWLKPQVDLAALLLRLGLAAIFCVHGGFKVVQTLPLLDELTLASQTALGWTELICGILLALGLLSRLSALVLAALQVGAIILFTGHLALRGPMIGPRSADYTVVGPEYNLVLIAMCLCVVLLGSGAISVDRCLVNWWASKKATTTGAAPSSGGASVPVGSGSASSV
jgi:uncharacterized membrane protein YphA (DoxX/SURF4 family)